MGNLDGTTVIFKKDDNSEAKGRIIDSVKRMHHETESGKEVVISGYLVRDLETDRVMPITYFQIKEIV